MANTKPAITERQQFWLDHIKAAAASNGTLVDYAAARELKVRDLYQWKRKLIGLGLLPGKRGKAAFVPVAMSTRPPRSGCLVTLRNGVQVQINGEADAAFLERVLAAAHALS